MGNIAGMLWYLHNEIVWHEGGRRGTFFNVPKTRLERFKVSMRAPEPLYEKGMNFGVVNTFDAGKCTGPFGCVNFKQYGYTVGCETWDSGSPNNFPHQQWDKMNHYPDATWYSLPGTCPSQPVANKTAACREAEPGGACPTGQTPNGESNCIYSYEKLGEISIDELEGIGSYEALIKAGGKEYDALTDRGVGTTFWDNKNSSAACQQRIQAALNLFEAKFPSQPKLQDPKCDFNKYVFYAASKHRV